MSMRKGVWNAYSTDKSSKTTKHHHVSYNNDFFMILGIEVLNPYVNKSFTYTRIDYSNAYS